MCSFLLQNLTNFGLLLDMGGALLIFFNTPEMQYGVTPYLIEELKYLDKKAKKQRRLARTGALLLFLGFALQLAANFLD
jgi:hypothetical protein